MSHKPPPPQPPDPASERKPLSRSPGGVAETSDLIALRQEAATLRALLDASPDILYFKDADLNFRLVNPAFCGLMGLPEEKIIGRSGRDPLFRPESMGEIGRDDLEVINRGEPRRQESRLIGADGVPRWFLIIKTPLVDEQGRITGILGIGQDITRIRALTHLLEEADARLSCALQGAGLGVWNWNLETDEIYWSEDWLKMLGYQVGELTPTEATWMALLHPEDRARVLAYGSDYRANPLGSYELEFRLRHKQGYWVDILSRAILVRDGQGAPVLPHLLIGTHMDLGERKRQQRLSELHQRLLEMVGLDDQEVILQTALDVAEELTHSQIGFLQIPAEEGQGVSLQIWSSRTGTEKCLAEGLVQHYPVGKAGVFWVDSILQRQPVIHNDYAQLPHKKGMPDGHAALVREATVPLLIDDRVIALMGVGNKPDDYNQQDLALLSQILEMAIHFHDRQRSERHRDHLASYDLLTALPNRSLLVERLNQALAHGSHNNNQLIALCYLNIDDFKVVNDTYGQTLGDALLVGLARRLETGLPPGACLARTGGDEFALILPGLSSSYESEEAVQRLLMQITQPLDVQGHRLFVSASLGITLYPLDPDGPDALVQHAQKAMYQAKARNRSGYHYYDPIQDQQLHQLRRMREEFSQALRDNQLSLYYQPQIALKDGTLMGLEALIRWRHPREGLLEAHQFLPQIKNSPLEIALGEWVVTQALAQLQEWRQSGLALAVSINVSPRQIQMHGFLDFLTRSLAAYPQGTGRQLTIEIPEITEISDTPEAARVMQACKALGIQFALDDFGTGYASLTYFHHLPIDLVKIDQHFVREILDNNESLGIIEASMGMANALQRPVVAEGIESPEIGLMLVLLGCQFGQGDGIAKPMPAERVPTWLTKWGEEALWHQLGQELLDEAVKYDLQVAIASLRLWLDRLLTNLSDETCGTSPPLDEYQCQFHRWYQGIGRTRYGSNPNFPFIQAQHYQFHQLGAMLADLAASGRTQEAQARRGELEAIAKEMTRLLRGLVRS